jgi:hypothetical protein
MASPQLLDCPTEVLHSICRLIRIPSQDDEDNERIVNTKLRSSIKSLSAFSRTCKLLHTIALPVLFHSLAGRAVLILRTLLARPDLAATVRILRLDEESCFEKEEAVIKTALVDAGIKLPGDGQDSHQDIPAYVYGDTGLSGRLADAVIAQLPELEELEHTPVFWLPRTTPSERGAFLPKLKRLRTWYCDIIQDFAIDTIATRHKGALDLEYLKISMLHTIPYDLSFSNIPVRVVTLSRCILTATDLQDLAKACPEIESFSYSSGSSYRLGSAVLTEHADPDNEATPRQIQQALWPRRATIRHLDFDFGRGRGYPDENRVLSELDYLESFKDFTSLETIVISLRWLPRLSEDQMEPLIGLLPQSLQALSIADYIRPGYAFNGILGLSEAVVEGQLPNLGRIEFDQSGPEAEKVREQFTAAGVNCESYIPDSSYMYPKRYSRP